VATNPQSKPIDLGCESAENWLLPSTSLVAIVISVCISSVGGSIAEWLDCWTEAQKGPGSYRSRDAVGETGLNQFVHTHCAPVHHAAKLMIAALLRVAVVTAGLVESNGSLRPGLLLTSPAG